MNDHYRAAIYLNNVGVTLLNGGSSNQALITLRDAVQIISILCSRQQLPESSLVDAAKRRATQSLARPKIDHNARKSGIAVIAQDALVYSSFNCALQNYYYVVHIDSIDPSRTRSAQDLDTMTYDIECATMLFNLGMTYKLLNKECPVEALVAFALAYSLLEPTIQKWLEGSLLNDKNRMDECDWCRILLIGFLSLQKLKEYALQVGIDKQHAAAILKIMEYAIVSFQKLEGNIWDAVAAAA